MMKNKIHLPTLTWSKATPFELEEIESPMEPLVTQNNL